MVDLFKSKKAHGRYKHMIIAIAVLGLLYYLNLTYNWIEVPTDTITILQLIGIGLFYSILSDCDLPGTVSNKIVITVAALIALYSFYNPVYHMYGIIAVLVILILRWVEHRTLLHSLTGALVLSAPLLYLGAIYFIVGFIAYLSHIISEGEFSIFHEKDNKWSINKIFGRR